MRSPELFLLPVLSPQCRHLNCGHSVVTAFGFTAIVLHLLNGPTVFWDLCPSRLQGGRGEENLSKLGTFSIPKKITYQIWQKKREGLLKPDLPLLGGASL